MAIATNNARAIVAKRLLAVIRDGVFLDRALNGDASESVQISPAMQEICYGTVRWYHQLDAIARVLLEKPLKPKDQEVYILLLMGLYQLQHMRLPAHAAVNETVSACIALGKPWAKNLLNACLRRFQREQELILGNLETDPEATFSHPLWFINALKQAWPQQWQQILIANNERPTLGLRVNQLKLSRKDYLDKLADNGIDAAAIEGMDNGIQLLGPHRIADLPGFTEGEVSVQNGSAQLAAELLNLAPGQHILDACAAPGGKLGHILEKQPNLAEVTAIEIEARRVKLIEQTLSRLSLDSTILQADACFPDKWWNGQLYDRILLDAPCSGTGVIRRHPDIKLHRTQ
ncbi:MAG: 16S rRNA (cytosine(967)-C(5))-methyltransferase RsmB, partial [Gammaproteobacteria bacterium]|nr:16S rRNA (cytosine(967)-C(5))-methyltransferase RsmB [Gammaproteobacteria bacterium]